MSLQEEESPIIFLNQPSPNLTTSADEEEKAWREDRINDFLDQLGIDQIAPGDINSIKMLNSKSKASLTPKLKLNCNPLLIKRQLKKMSTNQFSDLL